MTDIDKEHAIITSRPSREETIATDPRTGAQKGTKLARFDLMPKAALGKVLAVKSPSIEIEDLLWEWWVGRDRDGGDLILGKVAQYCLSVMEPHGQVYVAQVYGYGAKKYAPRNWEKGYAWSLSFTALMRHLWAHWSGEYIDPETGLPHVAHAAWHCLALLTWMDTHPELDDRPHELVPLPQYRREAGAVGQGPLKAQKA